MTVRYDPLLCSALAAELTVALSRRPLGRLYLDRGGRTAVLAPRKGPALVMLLHPTAGFILHREWTPPVSATHSALTSINLKGLSVESCDSPPDERIIAIALRGAEEEKRLVLELATNQWNLLLVDSPNTIEALLWTRRSGDRLLRQGGEYVTPRSRRRFGASVPSAAEWRAHLGPVEPADRRRFLLAEVAYTSSINVDYLVGATARGDDGSDEDVDEAWVKRAHGRYSALRSAVSKEAGAARPCLLARKLGRQPYVADLRESDALSVASVLDGMAAAFADRSEGRDDHPGATVGVEWTEEDPELAELRGTLERRAERLRRRAGGLRRELERGPQSTDLRSIGDLLLARIAEVRRGMSSVRLADFEGAVRQIELDPRRQPAENAARYYDLAGRRERAERELPRQISELEAELGGIETTLGGLEAHGVSDEAWRVAGGKPAGGGPAAGPARAGSEAPRLPYRRLRTSGGLELRVGRGARDNDELTFRHSTSEDIWLHAQQVKGAHVVLRWGRRDENPPQRDLLEAAVAAAVHSDARHSGTVGVDWTRRKYVRKPRKAPPGTVTIERVKTVFVEPDEDLVKRLADNG